MRPSPWLAPLFALALPAAGPAWLSDLEAGREAARAGNKPLLVHFTGSAWCPPCRLLHAEVLEGPAFAAWARDRVLVVLDYPPLSARSEDRIKADPALARLMALKAEFKVPGFPTAVLLAPDGRELGRTSGYAKGDGTAAWLAALQKGK